MSEAESQAATAKAEVETFAEILKSLVGKTVTMANPESLEEAPVGQQLTTGIYRARILGVQKDYISAATEYKRRGREQIREPVKQFIPLANIKRITIMKAEAIIHI